MKVARHAQATADRIFYSEQARARRFVSELGLTAIAAALRDASIDEFYARIPGPPMHYVLDGKVARPVPFSEHLQQMEQRFRSCEQGDDIWRVGRTDLPNGGYVSTVFLGLDHGLWRDGPPHIFETMVFLPAGDDYGEQLRYSTWEEAEAGHKEAVERHTRAANAVRKLKGAE